MGYTKTGPFVDGSSNPGISAEFLNNVENWLVNTVSDTGVTSSSGVITATGLILGVNLLKLSSHSTVKNGSTSGTMTVYEFFASGSALKFVICAYNNYKNAAATANTVTLQAPFTGLAFLLSGNAQGTQFTSSGSTVNINIITALGTASANGTSASGTKLGSNSMGQLSGAFDTIKEPGSNTLTQTGSVFILGY